jgi:hypothetical protein
MTAATRGLRDRCPPMISAATRHFYHDTKNARFLYAKR